MFKCLKNNTPCLPAWWIPWILKYPRSLLAIVLCSTAVLLFFTVHNFKINTDLTEMIANDLPFRQVVKKYHAEFPDLVGTIVVVVEGDIPEQVRQARDILADRLRHDNTLFKSIYTPGGGAFFDRNGLLYLSTQKLEEQGDILSSMQPFLALLSQDFSLTGLFSVVSQIVEQDDISIDDNEKLIQLFNSLEQSFSNVREGKKERMSWQSLMLEKGAGSPKKQFIILQPVLDYQRVNPAKQGIKKIREAAGELQLSKEYSVSINITGKPVINYEDLRSVRTDIGIASLVSFVLVGITLYLGLGSLRLVFAGLSTLMIGLVWSIGFAILLVGQLNMISVTFVVLFIGLGIDYSIQISLRYKELLASGRQYKEAISEAINLTGNTLLVCSISTAIGFYAFVPTAYVGASELGLIAGTGMLIIFLASITILPAMMSLMPEKNNLALPLSLGKSFSILLEKKPRLIVVGATVLTLIALAILSAVSFDANPFNLSDQNSKSVITAMKLFEGDKTSPWTISVLAPGRKEAENVANQLRQLPEVKAAVTIDNLIPKNQAIKLEQIEDLALVLPPPPPQKQKSEAVASYQHNKQALADLSKALLKARNSPDGIGERELTAINNLARTIQGFGTLLTGREQGKAVFARLSAALLPNLEILLNRLNTLMEAEEIDLAQLPPEIVNRYISQNGLYRIQVFPKKDLRNIKNLQNFVSSVQTIAPDATDQPVTILGAGKTIVSAFRNASILALILIAFFLRIIMKDWTEVMLILAPLLLALCYTIAAAILLKIPFNFANIIVVPLLLGIGVDFSLHIVHRVKQTEEMHTHILETSTSRGVLFSSLTTIMSFGSLSFMHHAGTASIGKLLTLSVTLMILCTLILLPAYLELYSPFKKQQDPPQKN